MRYNNNNIFVKIGTNYHNIIFCSSYSTYRFLTFSKSRFPVLTLGVKLQAYVLIIIYFNQFYAGTLIRLAMAKRTKTLIKIN